jgi:hypothetical protein
MTSLPRPTPNSRQLVCMGTAPNLQKSGPVRFGQGLPKPLQPESAHWTSPSTTCFVAPCSQPCPRGTRCVPRRMCAEISEHRPLPVRALATALSSSSTVLRKRNRGHVDPKRATPGKRFRCRKCGSRRCQVRRIWHEGVPPENVILLTRRRLK